MIWETWLAFAIASFVVLVIPGPTLLLAVTEVARGGLRVVPALALGTMAGDFVAMSVSLVGLGALIATSAEAFALLKWFAAGYLVYLGVQRWRHAGEIVPPHRSGTRRQLALRAFAVTALNPKSIAFFVAFLPGFIDPSLPMWPQVVVLLSTFVGLAGLNIVAYGFLAARVQRRFRQHRYRVLSERVGGSVLIGAGGLVALADQN